MRFGDAIQLRTTAGRPVTAGDVTVTPQSQVLILRLPFGGLVWNRPRAVLVEQGGQTHRVSIVDVTRLVQWGLVGAALLLSMVFSARSARRKEQAQ